MNQPRFLQYTQRVEKLCCEDLDELRAQALELVLLNELVQVRGEKFKDEAQMVPMDE